MSTGEPVELVRVDTRDRCWFLSHERMSLKLYFFNRLNIGSENDRDIVNQRLRNLKQITVVMI